MANIPTMKELFFKDGSPQAAIKTGMIQCDLMTI
jgi:hypothetical protein